MDQITGPGGQVDNWNAGAAVVAAADNGRGSIIPLGVSFVQVTAVATDANDWVTLPAGVQPGHQVVGWSIPAHELRTVDGSGVLINNVDSDGTQEAAIPATTLWVADYMNATTGWILRAWTELAAPITAIVPD